MDQCGYLLRDLQPKERREDSGRGWHVADSKAKNTYLDPPLDHDPGS
jgi:hypothetical protein